MKPRISFSNARAGSVLMMTLFSAMLIGTVLASYLLLVRHQDVAVSRSQSWNASLALAEAGVEEALAQLNSGAASFSGDLSANGWGPSSGGNFNLRSRALHAGRYDVRYFTNALSPAPTIISTGYVTIPALSATVARQIKVATKSVPLINMALMTKYALTVNGGGITAESYNSVSPSQSGITNGDVGSLYGPISLGTPNIKGDLFLGPAVTGGSGISSSQVSGSIRTDFNVDYPDVAAPAGALSWVDAPDDGTKHDFGVVGSRDYVVRDSKRIIVRPAAKVRLYVPIKNFAPVDIQVMTNNVGESGTLIIYHVSGTAVLPGDGKLLVQGGQPANFQYYGLPRVTSVTFEGKQNFVGVIYAPSANVVLNEGYTYHFYGACIARSVTINNCQIYHVHFDENLLKAGPIRGFVAKQWEEL